VDAPPTPPKQDKAALLSALYGYLGARIDSVGRRSSLLMAFLASFLGFALSPLMRTSDTSVSEKLQFTLSHPSLAVGIAGMIVLLWSELARVRRADDLFTKIAFSDVEIGPLQEQFLKFTGRRSGLRAWRGLPDGVGRASTVARDRTRTRRLRARGQRRTGFEDFRIGGHRGVPRAGESVGGFERLNRHLGATQRVLHGWLNRCPPFPSRRS
jgi:hypothetical protein